MSNINILRFDQQTFPSASLQAQAVDFFSSNYEPVIERLSGPEIKADDIADFANFDTSFSEGKVLYLAMNNNTEIIGLLRSETLRDIFPNPHKEGAFHLITVHNLEWIIANPKGTGIGNLLRAAFDTDTSALAQIEAQMNRVVIQMAIVFRENPSFKIFTHWGFGPFPEEIQCTTDRGTALMCTNRRK